MSLRPENDGDDAVNEMLIPFHSLLYQQKRGITMGLNQAPSSFTCDLSHILVEEKTSAALWGYQLLNSASPSTQIISV